jgi:ribosomal protein S18 acetylase RimI-like enzyme
MYPLTITPVKDEKELRLLRDFMLKQPQLYPNYKEWVDGKCQMRIENDMYKTLVAISGGVVVGDAVYQYLSDGAIEIKNFRIDSEYRNRDLGHFLLRQLEMEAKLPRINLDVSVDNFLGVQFFIRNKFDIVQKAPLYSKNQQEYLMVKKFVN